MLCGSRQRLTRGARRRTHERSAPSRTVDSRAPTQVDGTAGGLTPCAQGSLSRAATDQEVVLIRSYVLAACAAIVALLAPSSSIASSASDMTLRGQVPRGAKAQSHTESRQAHRHRHCSGCVGGRSRHRPGCRSRRCDHRVDVTWSKHHRPRARTFDLSSATAFDICVADNETGEPGSRDPRFIRWHAGIGRRRDTTYTGAFQFDEPTWREAGGQRFARVAGDATPGEQLHIFHRWERTHPSAWPNTVPPCVGSG